MVVDDSGNHLYGAQLPMCPHHDNYDEVASTIRYVTTWSMYLLWVVLSLVFIMLTVRLYFCVKVFHDHVRKEEINNTRWLLFFVFFCARGILGVVRYMYTYTHNEDIVDLFVIYAGVGF